MCRFFIIMICVFFLCLFFSGKDFYIVFILFREDFKFFEVFYIQDFYRKNEKEIGNIIKNMYKYVLSR